MKVRLRNVVSVWI